MSGIVCRDLIHWKIEELIENFTPSYDWGCKLKIRKLLLVIWKLVRVISVIRKIRNCL